LSLFFIKQIEKNKEEKNMQQSQARRKRVPPGVSMPTKAAATVRFQAPTTPTSFAKGAQESSPIDELLKSKDQTPLDDIVRMVKEMEMQQEKIKTGTSTPTIDPLPTNNGRKGPRRFTLLDRPTLKEEIENLMSPFSRGLRENKMKPVAYKAMENFVTTTVTDAEYQYNVARSVEEEAEATLMKNMKIVIREFVSLKIEAAMATFKPDSFDKEGNEIPDERFEFYNNLESVKANDEKLLMDEFVSIWNEVKSKGRKALEDHTYYAMVWKVTGTIDGKNKLTGQQLAGELQKEINKLNEVVRKWESFTKNILAPFAPQGSFSEKADVQFAAKMVANYFTYHHNKPNSGVKGMQKMFGTIDQSMEFCKRMEVNEGVNATQFWTMEEGFEAEAYVPYFEEGEEFYNSEVLSRDSTGKVGKIGLIPRKPKGLSGDFDGITVAPTAGKQSTPIPTGAPTNKSTGINTPVSTVKRRQRNKETTPTPVSTPVPAPTQRFGSSSSSTSSTTTTRSPWLRSQVQPVPVTSPPLTLEENVMHQFQNNLNKRTFSRFQEPDNRRQEKEEEPDRVLVETPLMGDQTTQAKKHKVDIQTIGDLYKDFPGGPEAYLSKMYPGYEDVLETGLKSLVDVHHCMALQADEPEKYVEKVAKKQIDFNSSTWETIKFNFSMLLAKAQQRGLFDTTALFDPKSPFLKKCASFVTWATMLGAGAYMMNKATDILEKPSGQREISDDQIRTMMEDIMSKQMGDLTGNPDAIASFDAAVKKQIEVIKNTSLYDGIFTNNLIEFAKSNFDILRDPEKLKAYELQLAAREQAGNPQAMIVNDLIRTDLDRVKLVLQKEQHAIDAAQSALVNPGAPIPPAPKTLDDEMEIQSELLESLKSDYDAKWKECIDTNLHEGCSEMPELKDHQYIQVMRSMAGDVGKTINGFKLYDPKRHQDPSAVALVSDSVSEQDVKDGLVLFLDDDKVIRFREATDSDKITLQDAVKGSGAIFGPREGTENINYLSKNAISALDKLQQSFGMRARQPTSVKQVEVLQKEQMDITKDIIMMARYFKKFGNAKGENSSVLKTLRDTLALVWGRKFAPDASKESDWVKSTDVNDIGGNGQVKLGNMMFDYLVDKSDEWINNPEEKDHQTLLSSVKQTLEGDANGYKEFLKVASTKFRTNLMEKGAKIVSPLGKLDTNAQSTVGMKEMLSPISTGELKKRYDQVGTLIPVKMSLNRTVNSVGLTNWITETSVGELGDNMELSFKAWMNNTFDAVKYEVWGWATNLPWSKEPMECIMRVLKKLAVSLAATLFTATFPVCTNILIASSTIFTLVMMYQRMSEIQGNTTLTQSQVVTQREEAKRVAEGKQTTRKQLNDLASSVSRGRWLPSREVVASLFNGLQTAAGALSNPISNLIWSMPMLGVLGATSMGTWMLSGLMNPMCGSIVNNMANSILTSRFAVGQIARHLPMMLLRSTTTKAFTSLLTMVLYHLGKWDKAHSVFKLKPLVGKIKLDKNGNQEGRPLGTMLGQLPAASHLVLMISGMFLASYVTPIVNKTLMNTIMYPVTAMGGGDGDMRSIQRDIYMAEIASGIASTEQTLSRTWFNEIFLGIDYDEYMAYFLHGTPFNSNLKLTNELITRSQAFRWEGTPKDKVDLMFNYYGLPRHNGALFDS
jgi:hypothetical protein